MNAIMKQANAVRYDVTVGRRTIGFIMYMQGAVPAGWRFLANKGDIAAKMPVPAPVFDTANAALSDLNARLA